MQIHLSRAARCDAGDAWEMRIFSKSSRDSTYERACVHAAILGGLGLDPAASTTAFHTQSSRGKVPPRYAANITDSIRRVQKALASNMNGLEANQSILSGLTIEQDIIVEAEMVPWDAGAECIAPFYAIEQIKTSLGGPWNFLYHAKRYKAAAACEHPQVSTGQVEQRLASLAPSDLVTRIQQDIADDVILGCEIGDPNEALAARLRSHPQGPFVLTPRELPDRQGDLRKQAIEYQVPSQTATQSTVVSDSTSVGPLHLAVVFFDVLRVDGVTLVQAPYRARRELLSRLVRHIPSHSMLSHAVFLDLATGRQRSTEVSQSASEDDGLGLHSLPTHTIDRLPLTAREAALAAITMSAYPVHPSQSDAVRRCMTLDRPGPVPSEGIDALESIFAESMSQRDEGLVLKSMDAPYMSGSLAHGSRSGHIWACRRNRSFSVADAKALGEDVAPELWDKNDAVCSTPSQRCPQPHPGSWVKLKPDYVGIGDSLDLVVIGASTNRKRSAELGLASGTLVNLHLGALRRRRTQPKSFTDCSNHIPFQKTKVHSWFSCMWGLGAAELARFTERVNSGSLASMPYPCQPRSEGHPPRGTTSASNGRHEDTITDELDYILTFDSGHERPEILLRTPLLVEVLGAGFQKVRTSSKANTLFLGQPLAKRWVLRWPRITRILYPPSDKSWEQAVEMTEIKILAKFALRASRKSGLQKGLLASNADRCNQRMQHGRAGPGSDCPNPAVLTASEHKRLLENIGRLTLARGQGLSSRFCPSKQAAHRRLLAELRVQSSHQVLCSRKTLYNRVSRWVDLLRSKPKIIYEHALEHSKILPNGGRVPSAHKPSYALVPSYQTTAMSPDTDRNDLPTVHSTSSATGHISKPPETAISDRRAVPALAEHGASLRTGQPVPVQNMGSAPVSSSRPSDAQLAPRLRRRFNPLTTEKPLSICQVSSSHPLSDENMLAVRPMKSRGRKRKQQTLPADPTFEPQELEADLSMESGTQFVAAESLRGMLLTERHAGLVRELSRPRVNLKRLANQTAVRPSFGCLPLDVWRGHVNRTRFPQVAPGAGHQPSALPTPLKTPIRAKGAVFMTSAHVPAIEPANNPSSPASNTEQWPKGPAPFTKLPSVPSRESKCARSQNSAKVVEPSSPQPPFALSTSVQYPASGMDSRSIPSTMPRPSSARIPEGPKRRCHLTPCLSETLVHLFLPHTTLPFDTQGIDIDPADQSLSNPANIDLAVRTFERAFHPTQTCLTLDTLLQTLNGIWGRAHHLSTLLPPAYSCMRYPRYNEVIGPPQTRSYRTGIIFVHQQRLAAEPAVAQKLFERLSPLPTSYVSERYTAIPPTPHTMSSPSPVARFRCHVPLQSGACERPTPVPARHARRLSQSAHEQQTASALRQLNQAKQELCPGTAFYPGSLPGVSGVVVLDWHYMSYVRLLMDLCAAECGSGGTSTCPSSPSLRHLDRGCTCCRHLDMLVQHVILPPYPQ